jgi:hypothetical protein
MVLLKTMHSYTYRDVKQNFTKHRPVHKLAIKNNQMKNIISVVSPLLNVQMSERELLI